jgi:hypothetical protein
MTSKCLSMVLIIALGVVVATPAHASSNLQTDSHEIVGGIVAASAAVGVLIIVLVLHHNKSHHSAITGCVTSGAEGMTLTDEKDSQVYALSGNTAGVKPGDRIKLQGKKVQSTESDKSLGWEATDVTKDFGACQ